MALLSLRSLLFTILLILSATNFSAAKNSGRPHGLILPVRKDPSTLQYITHIFQRTPLVPVNLVVDLGGQFLWVDCENGYVSSSYMPARCGSKQCKLAKSTTCGECYSAPRAGCSNNTCGMWPDNTVVQTASNGELTQDVISLNTTNGSNLGPAVVKPRFLFTCAPRSLLDKLAKNVQGMAGLGRTKISLPIQLSSAFKLPKKFGLCLTASTSSNGVIFFGKGPYRMSPGGMDISKYLRYTPLFKNPVSTASVYSEGDASSEYFIGVKAIKISNSSVLLNKKLLSFSKDGQGGTKISSVNPYTVMESSIYNAVTKAFLKEAAKMSMIRVASVAPFGVCFNSKNIIVTRGGPLVPYIDLVLQAESVFWRIAGGNSMVRVNNDVMCLGFVDGGLAPRTSIVIGAHQLEDNLLQFDLGKSRLGFSSSLFLKQTACANFDFSTGK